MVTIFEARIDGIDLFGGGHCAIKQFSALLRSKQFRIDRRHPGEEPEGTRDRVYEVFRVVDTELLGLGNFPVEDRANFSRILIIAKQQNQDEYGYAEIDKQKQT